MSEHFYYVESALRNVLPLDFPPSLPVYVVSQWDVGRDFFKPRDAVSSDYAAWTSCDVDLWLRGYLESEGRWKGRGFAFVVQEQFAPSGEALLHVALHEAAHFFDYQSADVARPEPLTPPPRWEGHGAGWLRAALHLIHRARSRGFPATAESLNLDCYLLADPFAYSLALDGEPERRADEPLAVVLADAPSPRFSEFAAQDIAHKQALWNELGAEFVRHIEAIRDGGDLGNVSPDFRRRYREFGSLPR